MKLTLICSFKIIIESIFHVQILWFLHQIKAMIMQNSNIISNFSIIHGILHQKLNQIWIKNWHKIIDYTIWFMTKNANISDISWAKSMIFGPIFSIFIIFSSYDTILIRIFIFLGCYVIFGDYFYHEKMWIPIKIWFQNGISESKEQIYTIYHVIWRFYR